LADIPIVSVVFSRQWEFDGLPIPLGTIEGRKDFHRLSAFLSSN
jgi:hypothetical protein